MYEELIFKVGVWTGYFLTILLIFMVFALALQFENRRKEKFLVETKSIQQYEEWKKKNTYTFKKG